MKKTFLSFLAGFVLFGGAAVAQTYPSNNPSYEPTAVLAPVTLSAPGTANFNANSIGTLNVRVSGTFTGLTATVQITESRSASPTWTNVTAYTVGGVPQSTITGTGLYRVNVAGAAQVRVNVTAISTGSVVVSASGNEATGAVINAPLQRSTYTAGILALVPAASATDIITLTGSATTTVRVVYSACSGISTAAGTTPLVALTRSTADTGGTSSTITPVSNDPNNPAPTAVLKSYTANPGALGTLVANGRAGWLTTGTAASSGLQAGPLEWSFGDEQSDQEIVLRGATAQFALNSNGVSWPAGTSLYCSVSWTEE